jgi:DNA invertase Pin-like site-specific DNA recombinase
MFQMCGVFAEFERGMIRKRVNAGLARAKAKGVNLGRHRIAPQVEQQILELRKEGMGRAQDRPTTRYRDERRAAGAWPRSYLKPVSLDIGCGVVKPLGGIAH